MPSSQPIQKHLFRLTLFLLFLGVTSCAPKTTSGLDLPRYQKTKLHGYIAAINTINLDKNASDYLNVLVPDALLEAKVTSNQGKKINLIISKAQETLNSDRSSYRNIAQDNYLSLQYIFSDAASGKKIVAVESSSLGQSSSIVSSRLDARINAYKHNIEALTRAFEKYTGKEPVLTSKAIKGDSNIITWITQAPIIAIAETTKVVGDVVTSAAESIAENPSVMRSIASGIQDSSSTMQSLNQSITQQVYYNDLLERPNQIAKAKQQNTMPLKKSTHPKAPNKQYTKPSSIKSPVFKPTTPRNNTLQVTNNKPMTTKKPKQKPPVLYKELTVSSDEQDNWWATRELAEDLAQTNLQNNGDKACSNLGGYWPNGFKHDGFLNCRNKKIFDKINWRCRITDAVIKCKKTVY